MLINRKKRGHSSRSSAPSQPPTLCSYFECDTPIIAAQGWPAIVLDLAASRGGDTQRLVRGTGIFVEHLVQDMLRLGTDVLLSPKQCYQLLHNIERQLGTANGRELSFLLGQRLFPGNFGAATNTLLYASHLGELLDALVAGARLLSPLLQPRLEQSRRELRLYWQDSCGACEQNRFLVEMMCAALASLSRWLSGEALPWRYYFNGPQPEYIEEYQVHLGQQLHFNAQACFMSIDLGALFKPWPKGSPGAMTIAQHQTAQHITTLPQQRGFLVAVYDYLRHHIAHNPSLASTAAAFGMSSASFKRKLQKHHTHFQAQYDLVRKDLALYWLNSLDLTNEQLAARLHFHDAANLRRAFKKWTGLTPSETRELFCGEAII